MKNEDIAECIIHNDTKIIAGGAFYACYNLTSVTIGKNVQTIGDYAFLCCDNLESVTFQDPNGWVVENSDGDRTSLESSGLSDPSKAAGYCDSYYDCIWTKNQ